MKLEYNTTYNNFTFYVNYGIIILVFYYKKILIKGGVFMRNNFLEGVEGALIAIFAICALGLGVLFLSPVVIGGIQLLRCISI